MRLRSLEPTVTKCKRSEGYHEDGYKEVIELSVSKMRERERIKVPSSNFC